MDWTKAKTILIIALLLTDCILGGLYYFQYVGIDAAPDSEIEATMDVLENHNIYVDTEIPEKTRRMPVLFIRHEETDEDEVSEVLSRQEENPDFAVTEQNLKALCEQIFKLCGFKEDTLVYDSFRVDEDGADVVYKNIFNGIAVEESGIRCRVEKGAVVSLDRTWLTALGYGKSKQRVIQSTDALIQFMSDKVRAEKNEDGQTPGEIHIKKIDLVYWLDLSVGPNSEVTEDTAVPAWRFTYNDGQETFIDAFEQQ